MNRPGLRAKIDINAYVSDSVGLPTLTDIMEELAKPGRDPREQFEAFSFAEGIEKITDLEPGMKLPGIVTNITAFGAFVDVGVHQDGLVHISQMAERYVKNPANIVKLHQKVRVTVLDVDLKRHRISLSMKPDEGRQSRGKQGTAPQKEKEQASDRGRRKPKKPDTPKPDAFNNPFADAFIKKGLK
jgi:uncharacterized protein